MSKSLPRRRHYKLESSFKLDGNSMTFQAPEYEPLLDKHLKPFFYNDDRLKLLKKNKLINRRYQVVDETINKKYIREQLMTRPSTQHLGNQKFSKSSKTTSTQLSPIKQSKSCYTKKYNLTPILAGFQKQKLKKFRKTVSNHKSYNDKMISKDLFQVFLNREKQKVKKHSTEQ